MKTIFATWKKEKEGSQAFIFIVFIQIIEEFNNKRE